MGDVKERLTLRDERAAVTRRRIAYAARALFGSRGYGATTLQAVADEAGVAVQTVYAVYGSKAGILHELRDTVLRQPAAEALYEDAMREPRAERKLELFASSIRRRWEFGHDVVAIHGDAAATDPSVRAQVEQVLGMRRNGIARLARSLEAEQQEAEKPPDPTWRELVTQLKTSAETKAALKAFTPQALAVGDQDLMTHPVYVATTELLRAWQTDNYGAMAGVITHMFRPINPKDVRNEYQGHELEEHEVLSLDHFGAAVCIARVRLRIDGSVHTPELRWIWEGPDGHAAAPNQAGDWRLMWWGFDYMTRDIDA